MASLRWFFQSHHHATTLTKLQGGISRSQVDRIFDPKRDITLGSLQRAAALVGQRVRVELV